MTITELENIIHEHKKDFEEDAEASEKTYIFMTCKDGEGMVSAAGKAGKQLNMALNILEIVSKQASSEMVLEGIKSLMVRILKDEVELLGEKLEEAEHEKVDNRTIS